MSILNVKAVQTKGVKRAKMEVVRKSGGKQKEDEYPRKFPIAITMINSNGENDFVVVRKKLSKGHFGCVYSGYLRSNGTELAIKYEDNSKCSYLDTEFSMYQKLDGQGKGKRPFSKVYMHHSSYMLNFSYMVMELHGKSFEKLVRDHVFSLKTVAMAAIQLITKLSIIHKKKIIHRDIKPANIVIGNGRDYKQIYIIDFGLSDFVDDIAKEAAVKKDRFTGTTKYASLNAQKGARHSYRDDMESLGYTLVFLLKGRLPWDSATGTTQEKFDKVMRMKATLDEGSICAGMPEEFNKYLTYVKRLGFGEIPNYNYLAGLFRKLMLTRNFKHDYQYDWVYSYSPPRAKRETF